MSASTGPPCTTTKTPGLQPSTASSSVKECAEYNYNVMIDPKNNSFASVRPDRNFISDDEMPLLFKNYCYLLLCGVC
jgi:hypothetical protein